MENTKRIIAEIERRKKWREIYLGVGNSNEDERKRFIEEYKSLLSFINSLPEEPESEDVEEAARETQWAAMEYTSKAAKESTSVRDWCTDDVVNAFIGGAKWQLEKACEWLKFNLQDYAGFDDKKNQVPFDSEVFEEFRKAMEE